MSEKEDNLKQCKLSCSNENKMEETSCREQSTHPYLYKSSEEKLPLFTENVGNYSTVAKSEEASIQITDKTTAFDLWKGLFYMFLSCVFKSLFSVLSKYTLRDKRDLSSFQLLTYRYLYFSLSLANC